MTDTTFDLWSSPGHLLRRCHQRSHEIFNELLGDTGVTRQQFSVLWALQQNPDANQQRLSEVTGWDRNTLAAMLGRLVDQKLIERSRDPEDARATRLRLTERGGDLLRDSTPTLREVQQRIIAPIPEAERPAFLAALRTMLSSAD
jgi:MarR family transcriptional regulator, lower aerobic nicotinate degradation pathway regulator